MRCGGRLAPGNGEGVCASRKFLGEDTAQNAWSFGCLPEFGADRKLHGRLNPDTAAVHPDDLFGDHKPKVGGRFAM